MAGEEFIIARIENDREEGIYLDEEITLGDLADRIGEAFEQGFGRDSKVKLGYLPNFLTGALHVVKPVYWRGIPFDEIKSRAISPGTSVEDSAAAWAEIRRRVERD